MSSTSPARLKASRRSGSDIGIPGGQVEKESTLRKIRNGRDLIAILNLHERVRVMGYGR